MDSLGKLVAGLLTSAQGDAAKTDRQEAAHNQDPWLGDLRYAAAAVMVATFHSAHYLLLDKSAYLLSQFGVY